VKLIRNNLHSESVETDLKFYLQPNLFSEWFEEKKLDRPINLKDGISVLSISASQLAHKELFLRPEVQSKPKKKTEAEGEDEELKDEFVRVRLLFYSKLKVFKKKIEEITKESLSTLRTKTIMSQKEKAQFEFEPPMKGQAYLEEQSSLIRTMNPSVKRDTVAVDDCSPNFDEDTAFRKFYWTNKKARKLAQGQLIWVLALHILGLRSKPGSVCRQVKASDLELTQKANERLKPVKEKVADVAEQQQVRTVLVPDIWARNSSGGWLDTQEAVAFERIIVHIHGGGFVAQSSSSHKVYMTKWVNDLKRPLFSIDYRLADADIHFPEPVNDVIKGYLWIINFLKHVVKVDPKQIVLVGDSAGGNMALCLATWCIVNKVRCPDSIMLFYPAMSTRIQQFTPSLLYSLSDFMLSYSTLKMCGSYYNNNLSNQETNPYLNPILLPDEIVSAMPMTEIYIGEKDPLRDDCVRYALRLLKLGVPIKLNYLQGLSHGLLSTSYKGGLPAAEAFFKEASKSLRETLNIPL
jgi:acetyl esterase/lipase